MTSPQTDTADDALDQAESQLVPIIIAALAAAAAVEAGTGAAEAYGSAWGVIGKGAWAAVPREAAADWLLKSLSVGPARKGIVDVLSRITYQRYLVDAPADEGWKAAQESAERAADQATAALQKFIEQRQRKRDAKPLFDEPAVDNQQRVESFSEGMARWLVRESMFGAQEQLAEIAGFTRKRWVTRGDHKVRPAHTTLDGRVVPVNSTFATEGGVLRYPGDTSAPIGLWVNCRCSLEWLR